MFVSSISAFGYAHMSQYEQIIVYNGAVDSKSTAYFPARPISYEWTDGRTDRQTRCLKGDHSQKVKQRVEVQSQHKKACGADCM